MKLFSKYRVPVAQEEKKQRRKERLLLILGGIILAELFWVFRFRHFLFHLRF